MSVGSAFSKERPSANQWHRRAFDVSWVSSWSLRCLQGSSKTGSSERHELKVDCCSLSVSWVYECSFFLKTFHEKAVCFSLCISTPAFQVLSVQKKALHLHWPLVAESFSTACFLTESKQLPEVLMFHILVLYPSFSFFVLKKNLCCCVDRSVWAAGRSIFGGAARHRAEWSQQVPQRPWWVQKQTYFRSWKVINRNIKYLFCIC